MIVVFRFEFNSNNYYFQESLITFNFVLISQFILHPIQRFNCPTECLIFLLKFIEDLCFNIFSLFQVHPFPRQKLSGICCN